MMTVGRATCIVFSDDDLPPEGSDHTRPFYIFVGCSGRRVPSVILDNGSTLNVCHLATAIALEYTPSDFGPSTQTGHVLSSRHGERMRARLIHTPFDYPVRPYTMRLTDYFVRASEPLTQSDGIIGGLSITQEAELQHLVCYLMTLYFPNEIDEHGTFAEVGDISGLASPFDLFGVFAIEIVEEILTSPAPKSGEDVMASSDLFDSHVGIIEGAFDFVDPPLSFDVLSGFVSHNDSLSASDLDPVDQRVSPAVGDAEVVDFDPTWTFSHGLMRTCQALIRPSSSIICHFCPMSDRLSRKEIQKQLSVGFLSMVEYPEWLANVVLVPKKDGKVRVCVDFRDLNKASPKGDFPLPHIDMLVDSTAGHSRLSFMDGFFGYIMPFRLKNVGATYQRAATTLFHDMMHRDVEVYVDDMIVKSRDRSDHLATLERFFERIRQFRLRLNPKKKSQPTVWDDQCQRAFEKIREYLLSSPVLAPPTPGRPLLLYLSVSDVALGCMLAQLDDSGKDRAIYYLNPLRYLFDRPALVGRLMRWLDVATVTSLLGWRMHFDGGEWKTRDAKLRPYHAYLELLVGRFDDLRYTHLLRVQNQLADALTTPTSMIDVPADATIRLLLIKSRSAPAYYCLIDDTEPDDDHEDWLLLSMETNCCQFVQRFPECQIHGDLIHWVEAASYTRLTSVGVANFIRSHIICRYGVPHELISDRGVHFRAEVDTLMNEAIEAANKNIKRILWRMVETSRDWSEKLSFTLWVYHTSFRTSTRATLYSLQILEADWVQARFDQLNLLYERRLRMTHAFKKRVKPRPLQIGDLVLKVIRGLIRDPRGKFRPNWSGPYFIKELTPEGAAWLMDLDRNRFSEPTNVDQLRRYYAHGSRDFLYMLHFIYEGMNQMSSSTASARTARPTIHPMPYWGIFPFWMRFADLHGVACLSPLAGTDRVHLMPYWGIFPPSVTEMIILSQICYSFHHSVEGYRICFMVPVFRAIISPQFRRSEPLAFSIWRSEPSTFSIWCSKPLFLLSSVFRAISIFHLAFRATISSQSYHQHFPFGVQSHYFFSGSAFKAISIFRLMFRAIIASQFWRSEPSPFSVSAFRAIIASQFGVQSHHYPQFRHSKPSSLLSFGVRSHHYSQFSAFRAIITSSVSAFRAITILSFGVQSHYRFSVLGFQNRFSSSVWR
ncbi:hypothetical protein AAG906_000453 [Vitis piasezkii]